MTLLVLHPGPHGRVHPIARRATRAHGTPTAASQDLARPAPEAADGVAAWVAVPGAMVR